MLLSIETFNIPTVQNVTKIFCKRLPISISPSTTTFLYTIYQLSLSLMTPLTPPRYDKIYFSINGNVRDSSTWYEFCVVTTETRTFRRRVNRSNSTLLWKLVDRLVTQNNVVNIATTHGTSRRYSSAVVCKSWRFRQCARNICAI